MPTGTNLTGSRWATSTARSLNHSLPEWLQNNVSSPAARSPERPSYPAEARSVPRPSPQALPPALNKSQKRLWCRYQEYTKFAKLLRRLKWKSCTLLDNYQRALGHIHRAAYEQQTLVMAGVPFPLHDGEAEMMFKIDFFEFYVLLERVLVHLLGAFDVLVSAAHGSDIQQIDGDGSRDMSEAEAAPSEQPGLIGDSRHFGGFAHRFHANVLSALDQESNPLHPVLGQGDVRNYLGIAKEFRNRWKDAEEKEKDEREDGLVGSRYERMLDDLNLEQMLGAILVALEHSTHIVQQHLERASVENGDASTAYKNTMMLDDQSSPLEAIPDAMEFD